MIRVGIIDLSFNNISSLTNAFDYLQLKYKKITTKSDLLTCDSIVLPGNSSFDSCKNELAKASIFDSVYDFINNGGKYLGICVGMQILFRSSEEGLKQGFGFFNHRIKLLNPKSHLTHIGWEYVHFANQDIPKKFYFLHKYCFKPETFDSDLGIADYPVKFCATIQKRNITACQFHPEKSGNNGLEFLQHCLG